MHQYTPKDISRFWNKVTVTADPDKCWEWTASLRKGYGQIRMRRSSRTVDYAHRVSYIIAYGEIADEVKVCHSCDNPKCCNPHHLFLGTHTDNSNDKVSKGRQATGENHGMHKLTNEQVLSARERFAAGEVTKTELARQMQVTCTTVIRLLRRESWKYI